MTEDDAIPDETWAVWGLLVDYYQGLENMDTPHPRQDTAHHIQLVHWAVMTMPYTEEELRSGQHSDTYDELIRLLDQET